MNSKIWIRKALSMCLMAATFAAYSMVALATSGRVAGEITVLGKNLDGITPSIEVNGETAQNGRSIFSSSTIVTPANASAIVNLGRTGKIELAPNTTLALSFNDKGISGDLFGGQVTVLDASATVNIKTLDGTVAKLNIGDSATAVGGKAQDDDDDDVGGGGGSWIIWAAILGGAAAGIVIAATTDNNRIALGGNARVVSPTR